RDHRFSVRRWVYGHHARRDRGVAQARRQHGGRGGTSLLFMPYQHLLASTDGQLGIITLNRPERRNALSLDLMLELIRCLDEFAADPKVRAIILAASGKVFSSGHDLSEMVGRSVTDY